MQPVVIADDRRGGRKLVSTRADGAVRVPLWVVLVAFVVLALVVADVRWHGPVFHLDHRIADRVEQWDLRRHTLDRRALSVGLWFGQRGVVLPGSALLALWLTWRTRTIEPLVRLLVAVVSLALVVYAFKLGLARNAPIQDAHGVPAGHGMSFPSGHIANAILLWGVADWSVRTWAPDVPASARVVLTRIVRVGRWIAPVAVFVVMTLLNYHWLSDFIGGAAIGAILLALAIDPHWTRIAKLADMSSAGRAWWARLAGS